MNEDLSRKPVNLENREILEVKDIIAMYSKHPLQSERSDLLQSGGTTNNAFRFEIVCPSSFHGEKAINNRGYVFECSSEEQRKEWIKYVAQVVDTRRQLALKRVFSSLDKYQEFIQV